MNPYSESQIDARRASEPHPVEQGFSALAGQYNDYIKSHSAADSVSYWNARSAVSSNNQAMPEMSDVWAQIKVTQGEQLNRSAIESYAQGKGSVWDAAMAKAYLPQYDDLGSFNMLGQDNGIDRAKLAQRIEDADLQESAPGYASSINSLLHPSVVAFSDTTSSGSSCAPTSDQCASTTPTGNPCDGSSSSTGSSCSDDSDRANTQHNLHNIDHASDKDSNDQDSNGNHAIGADGKAGSDSTSADCAAHEYKTKAGDTFWSIAAGMLSVPNDKAHAQQIYQLAQQISQLNPKYHARRLPIDKRIELPDLGSDGGSERL